MEDDGTDWKSQAGLADETTSARIYPSKVQKQRWKEETGGQSLSRYIIELVEEARLHRQTSTQNPSGPEKEELQERTSELEQELARTTQTDATPDQQEIYSKDVIKNVLTSKPVTQDELLKQLLESQRFQKQIADRVEKTLYSLAADGEITFSRNPTGWRLSAKQGGEQ